MSPTEHGKNKRRQTETKRGQEKHWRTTTTHATSNLIHSSSTAGKMASSMWVRTGTHIALPASWPICVLDARDLIFFIGNPWTLNCSAAVIRLFRDVNQYLSYKATDYELYIYMHICLNVILLILVVWVLRSETCLLRSLLLSFTICANIHMHMLYVFIIQL